MEKNEITLQTEIQKWNLEKSIETMQKKIAQWKILTVELARELYIAHKFLTSQQGQRTDPAADNYISYTWSNYCDDIGISPRTAHQWLKRFIPAELNDAKEDVLLTPEELKAVAEQELLRQSEGQASRIQKFKKTGKRPDDWTSADELEIRRQLAEAKAKELATRWSDKTPKIKPRKDYFQEILEITTRKKNKKFALATQEQNIIQERTFIALDQYLTQFEDYETRLMAAVNLQERLKQVVNVYAEEQIKISELENKDLN